MGLHLVTLSILILSLISPTLSTGEGTIRWKNNSGDIKTISSGQRDAGSSSIPLKPAPSENIPEVSVIQLIHRSREAVGSGRLEEALEWARASVSKDPAYSESWKQAGRVLMLMGNYPEALRYFQPALDLKPDDPEIQEWVIQALLVSDRIKELVEKIKKLPAPVLEGLDTRWVLYLLSRAFELKDHRAVDQILKTMRRKKFSPGAQFTLDVLSLISNGRQEEAERMLSGFQSLASTDGSFLGLAWFVLGRTYQGPQENSKAVTAYRKALDLSPEYLPIWRELGWALKRAGQGTEAADVWEQGVQKDPRYLTWLLWIAEARMENKQPEQALDALNRFLKVQPNDTNAQLLKLTILRLYGKKAELQKYEQQVKKIPDGDQLITLGRALTLQKQGEYPQAARLLESFYRLHPKDLLARELLINTYALWAAANPGREALEPLQNLVKLAPGRPGVFRDLGWSLLAHNRFDDAVQAWEQAAKDPSVDPSRLFQQIMAGLAEEGQGEQARKLFRRWEPGTSFSALGMDLLKSNRLIAAREFLTAAWEAGEEQSRLGLYLAYSEARTGYCYRVSEHLTPFITADLTLTTPDDFSYLLTTLSQCSFEPSLLPIVVRLDQLMKPFSEQGAEVTALLANTAAEQRKYQNLTSAWLFYQKALDRDPNRVQDWPMAAETALDLGLRSEAITFVEGLLNRTASAAVSEGIKGWLADIKNETEPAVSHYRKSLAIEPIQPNLRFILFRALMSLKRFDEARSESDWFRERIAAGENYLKEHLAETLSSLGKSQEALIYWRELYLANPERTRFAVETARELFSLGRAEEALNLLDSVLSKSPDPRGFELAAEIKGALGRTDQALKATEQGLSFKPTTILWQLQAEAAEVLKQPSLALTAAKNWAAADPGNVSAHQIIATALLAQGRNEEARTLLESLLQRNPNFLPGLIHLREIASGRKQTGLAEDYSRRTVQQRPWDNHASLQYSISLAEDERFVAAYKQLRPLASLEPNKAIPILVYRNVTLFSYPGRNTVSQVREHLQYLKNQGYDFITFRDLPEALSKNHPQILVMFVNTETDALLQIDAALERIKGQAILAVDYHSLEIEVPFQPSPKTLSQLGSNGRWVLAWSGVSVNDLRAGIDEKGTLGNVLTHKIVASNGPENAEAMERRLEKIFYEASAPFRKQSVSIFLYPGGDYGQSSLDTDPEIIGILQKTVSRYFDFGVITDPNGFVTSPFDPRHLPGRLVPATWDTSHLISYLRQQNPLVRARLELAKVLFWQGQQVQAGKWFKEAESAGADPEEVNLHWGNNAYQYGDLPTALTKLRLAQDLNPDSKRIQESLERALWQKKFFINPEGNFWKDSDHRSFIQWGLDLGGYLYKTLQMEIFGQRMHWERDGFGSENGTRLGIGGKWFFVQDHWIEGRVWDLQVDNKGDWFGGLINLHLSNPLWEGFANFQAGREQIDTVEAVRADIQANRFGLYTYSRLIDSFDCFADLGYTQRTDQNNTLLFNGRLVWRVKEWPYLGIGYAIRLGDSDRKAVEYYAPKSLEQHQIYFDSRGEFGLLHYKFSIQGGYAREEGTDWHFIWSTELDLDLRLTRRLELNGRYSHQESPLYMADYFTLGIIFRF